MREKIEYDEALNLLEDSKVEILGRERVFLHDALNRILADDIYATSNMPQVPLSSMDGYAISSKFKDHAEFVVLDDNPAGKDIIPTIPLESQIAIKTFTGAAMPHGADILVPIENVEVIGDKIKILKCSEVGEFIRDIGTNYKKGEKLLSKGTRLNANYIGLLASLNCVFVNVYEKPKVGILVSGDEILELGEQSSLENRIYNANGHLLYAKVKEYGGIPKLYPILKDNKELIEESLQDALKSCDLVVSTGGASVGDYDFISKIAHERKEEVIFKGVKIKPGQHVLYARFFGKHFFGLPGFPNATLVTFELFVVEILHKMCGSTMQRAVLRVPLGVDIKKKDKRLELRVCNVIEKDGKFCINFDDKKDFLSAILNNFCPVTPCKIGLVVLREEEYKKDSIVEVIVFG